MEHFKVKQNLFIIFSKSRYTLYANTVANTKFPLATFPLALCLHAE